MLGGNRSCRIWQRVSAGPRGGEGTDELVGEYLHHAAIVRCYRGDRADEVQHQLRCWHVLGKADLATDITEIV